jgi:putative ATP-dependent endonuclease of OLD family
LGEQPPPSKTTKAAPKKLTVEKNDGTEASRPNVLLIDEPEICLHPNAIREACRVLYNLARPGSSWQVMVTTHSPVLIDLTRDNTTIVRVDRNESGTIEGTTVFRPDRVKLDDNDKKNLKLLNVWDPYVGEFFFGGHTILVEGDTEYSVFRWLIDEDRNTFKNVHVVRARGKGILISLIKILNHFGADYSVLHDSDKPPTTPDERNSAWGTNKSILDVVKACPVPARVRLTAALPDFEGALFGSVASSDKPYKAVANITSNAEHRSKARQLLLALLDHSKPLPPGVIQWNNIEELEKALSD